MEIKAYFKNRKDLVGWLVKQLSILPDNICLKYLGVNEGVINKRDVISEEKLLNEYIAENPQGFFAFSEGKANANIEFENEYSSISMYCDDESSGELALNVDKIFGSFIKYNAYYIYSALDLEFRNKNKAIVQQNTDTIEFWLGRDINRYLPGIYWRNWVSEEYQDFLKINIHEVIDQAGLEEYDLGNGVYLAQDVLQMSFLNIVKVLRMFQKIKIFFQ